MENTLIQCVVITCCMGQEKKVFPEQRIPQFPGSWGLNNVLGEKSHYGPFLSKETRAS